MKQIKVYILYYIMIHKQKMRAVMSRHRLYREDKYPIVQMGKVGSGRIAPGAPVSGRSKVRHRG